VVLIQKVVISSPPENETILKERIEYEKQRDFILKVIVAQLRGGLPVLRGAQQLINKFFNHI
jgi:hypothetical protein